MEKGQEAGKGSLGWKLGVGALKEVDGSLGGQRVGGRWSEGHGNGREGDENQLQKKKKSLQMPSESLILVS